MDQPSNQATDPQFTNSPPAGADTRPDTDLRLQLPPAPPQHGPSGRGLTDEDLTEAHATQYQKDELKDNLAAIAKMGGGEGAPAEPTGPANTSLLSFTKSTLFSAASDVAVGTLEAPRAVLKGVRDAGQETVNSLYDLNDWAGRKAAGILGESYPSTAEAEKGKESLQLPGIKEPSTHTGKLVQQTAQFLTGLAEVNLLPGVGQLTKAAEAGGAVGKAAFAAAKGGMADFVAMDPHQAGFTELLKSYPKFEKNAILNYLGTNPNDSGAEGRLKNAIKGMLGGVVAEGLIHGLKALRAARIARQLDALPMEGPNPESLGPRRPAPGSYAEAVFDGDIADAQLRSTLGDPAEKLLTRNQRKLADATDAAEGATPQGVRAAAQNVTQDVDINWSRIDSRNDVKKLIQSLADANQEGIGEAQRGVRSWAKTKATADQKNALQLLLDRTPAGTFNAEQTVAVRQLWVSSAEKLSEVANVAAGSPSEANLFAFRKQLATHYMIQEEVLAARTEAGRALNAWAIPAGSSAARLRQMQAIVEGAGGSDLNQELAKRVASLSNPAHAAALDKLVEKSVWAKSMDVVQQAYMNAILSSPSTHAVIQTSSIITAMHQMLERGMAARIGQMMGTQNGVQLGEAMAMVYGQIEGWKDALRALRQTAGESATAGDSFPSKLADVARGTSALTEDARGALSMRGPVEQRLGALSPEVWRVARETPVGQALNLADTAMNVPGRLIQGGHEIHKMAGYRMELQAQAVRQAAQEVNAGSLAAEAVEKRVADIVANPPDRIKLAAVDQALYQTFTQKPNEVLNGLGKWTQGLTVCGVPVGRFLMPFKNTPINIINYALERTPMAPLTQAFKADVAAGGARADLAITRMATGTVTMMAVMDACLNGKVTGQGPKDPGERANLTRMGWQPYSIKVGDHYVGYNRLHPIGMTMGMAADIAEISANAANSEDLDKSVEKAMLASMFSVANVAVNASYLRGVADFTAAIHDSDEAAERWAKNMAGSLVPSGLAAAARQMDPYVKQTNSMIEAVQARVPYWNSSLANYRDLWGKKRDYRSLGMPQYDVVIPSHLSVEHPEPIDKELQRLQYYPAMPPKETEFKRIGSATGATIDLEKFPKAYERYVELSGNALKDPSHEDKGCLDYLNSIATGQNPRAEQYKLLSSGPDGGKAGFIQNTVDYYRVQAKLKLLDEFPELRVEFEQKKKPIGAKFDPSVFGGQYPQQ